MSQQLRQWRLRLAGLHQFAARVRKVSALSRSATNAFLTTWGHSLEWNWSAKGTIIKRIAAICTPRADFSRRFSATKLGGKENREIDVRPHVYEKPAEGRCSLLKANRPTAGQPHLHKSGAEFNPVMADGAI